MPRRSHQPVPVSPLPGELVYRAYSNTRPLPGLFDAPDVPTGTLLFVRRSPYLSSARSYWIEDTEGTLLALMREERVRKELQRAAWPPHTKGC